MGSRVGVVWTLTKTRDIAPVADKLYITSLQLERDEGGGEGPICDGRDVHTHTQS